MSAQPGTSKRRHGDKRLGERRRETGAGSSRDASEEDNEEELSDVGSLASGQGHTARLTPNASMALPAQTTHIGSVAPGISAAHRRALGGKKASPNATTGGAASAVGGLGVGPEGKEEGSQSDGVDSPVYDGDVESSSTIGGTPVHSTFAAAHAHHAHHHPHAGHIRRPSSPTPAGAAGSSATSPASLTAVPMNRLPTPKASRANLLSPSTPPRLNVPPADVPVAPSESLSPATKSQIQPLSTRPSFASLTGGPGPMRMMSRPVELSVEDIRAFVQRAIDGEGEKDGVERNWKTNDPPEGRPVRIYADGVYDLFHFGHALQLRQAKLSFANVHLLVGVCSDALCADHKSAPAMTHAERCESVRQCRWVDEVLPDAPWIVDQEWMDKYQIDYLAHDEMVYPVKGVEDAYAFAKGNGKFLPTRRTPCISTSDLLERIVRGYRGGFFDSKLEKNGLPELLAADVDWDSSASVEKRERRKKKAQAAQK